MFLLNSGANPNNGQNREKLSKEETRLKIIRGFLLFFVFVLLMGTTLWSVQWFSESLRGFLFWDAAPAPGVFSGSLETSAISILEPAVGANSATPKTFSGGDIISNAEVVPAPVKENPVMPETGEAPKPASLASEPKSFISVEIRDGRENLLASKFENEALPVASVTKLMTALISLEHYDVSKKITVNEGAMKQDGEQGNLTLGQTLSVKDLLYITLIESSNKSAYALASGMGNFKFVDLMNERARQLGMNGTYFIDSTGIRAGSASTASDIIKLSRHLFENYPLFREIISQKEFDLYLEDGTFHHKLINTNKLLGEVPGIMGGKTGWTNEAKGCFMVITENPETGSYSIHVVLGSDDRFGDMKKLINGSIAK